MVDEWTEVTSARERVETVATTTSEPRTANWVAEQAEVTWDTAKKHLEALVESGAVIRTGDDRYVADPTRAYFDHLRDLILNHDRAELRDELAAIADRVEEWKASYGVDSPAELEASLGEDRPADEIRDRRRTLRRWENSRQSRERIRAALALFDDVRSLTEAVPADARLEGTG